MTRIRRTAVLALIAAALALTGCGADDTGGESASRGDSGAARDAAAPAARAPAAPEPAAPNAQPGSGKAAATPAPTRVIRTADVVVEVQNLTTSAARVRAVATSLGGAVASETTNLGGPGGDRLAAPSTGADRTQAAVVPGESVVVLRIPVADFDAAITRVEAVGKPLSRSSGSQDVTGDVADLESRVSSQKASLARVRALMDRAGSLSEVVQLESELSRRESDLEALQARLASLADRADLSTLTVTLRTPAAQPADEDDEETGFLGGLGTGWDILVRSTVVVLTVLGVLLPPAVAVVAIGSPIWWLRRRARARRGGAAGGGPVGAGPPGPGGPGSTGGPGGPGRGPGPHSGPYPGSGPSTGPSTGPSSPPPDQPSGAPVPAGSGDRS